MKKGFPSEPMYNKKYLKTKKQNLMIVVNKIQIFTIMVFLNKFLTVFVCQ